MRILILTHSPRQPDNHQLWEKLASFADVELHYVAKEEQRHINGILERFRLEQYDRIVLDLMFRYLLPYARQLRSINGLVIYEEDACQEFIPTSRWRGKFSSFYRRVPHVRVIMTGQHIAQSFRRMGVDAWFLPKGYNSSALFNENLPRDIEIGFIGRQASSAYSERRALIERAIHEIGLQTLRTEPGEDYRKALNRIKIFFSADIGLSEYMAKNFEAMACGCMLAAYAQGNGEEHSLGLIDGENVILYKDLAELKRKLERLPPNEVNRIAANGEALARKKFDYLLQAESVFQILQPSTIPADPGSFLTRLLRRICSTT